MNQAPTAIERRAVAVRRMAVSVPTAKRHERIDPDWPRPIIIGAGGRVGYLSADVDRWIAQRVAASVEAPRGTPPKYDAAEAGRKGAAVRRANAEARRAAAAGASAQ